MRRDERSSSSKVRSQPRSLETLVKMELVWNRQRGGKGSLRVGEVVDALAGPQSQVNCSIFRGAGRSRFGGGFIRPFFSLEGKRDLVSGIYNVGGGVVLFRAVYGSLYAEVIHFETA